MAFVLGVDVGSQSVKAVLLDSDGIVQATASEGLIMAHPRAGWAEQDPRDWEVAVAAVIAKALATAGLRGTEVVALNLACQVDGVAPLSATGQPVGPAIIWLDRRAGSQATELATRIGARRLTETTGLIPDASHSGPKIMWLRENEPSVFASAAAFPPAAGYLLHWLTNELAVDHANASSSLLYDLRERRWSPELLHAAGVEESKLGRILEASDVAGTISARAAQITGLSTSCAVLVGTGDDHAGSIGAGVVAPGFIADITGTAEPVTVASKEFILDDSGLVETHAHAVPGCYLVENPGFVSGGSTLWLAEQVIGVSQAELFDLASGSPAGSSGVIFVPALSGATTPRWNGEMRGVFAGLAMSHTSKEMARAVLEGCAYALRDITDRFATMGLGHHEIRVVGGGASSELWMQIKADVTGRPVRGVLAKQATALGAALLAAVAVGMFADLNEAVSHTVELADEPQLPDARTHDLYEDSYGRYRALFDGVEGALA